MSGIFFSRDLGPNSGQFRELDSTLTCLGIEKTNSGSRDLEKALKSSAASVAVSWIVCVAALLLVL